MADTVASLQDLQHRPEDELLHEPTGDDSLPWKDTWYFSMFDEDSGIHLAMHMTISANRSPDTRIAVGVKSPGHERIEVRREQGRNDETRIGNSLAWIEVVDLAWEAGHQLRWRCEAPEFSFDVLVTGVQAAPDFHVLFPGANPSGKQGHSYEHFEQLIRGEGTLRWGDEERSLSAFGWRDRGWGRRKTETTFGSGYDLIGGILPDGSTFALSAMRNVEHGPDAPLPAYGFHADGENVSPAVGGIYHKDSQSFPARLALEFANGRRVDATQVRRTSTLGTPFHDAEPEHSGIAVHARDLYAVLADPQGAEFGVFSNEGHTMRADVTGDAKFFF